MKKRAIIFWLEHFHFSPNHGNDLSNCAIPDGKPLRTFLGIALSHCFCAIPDGKPLRTFLGIALGWFLLLISGYSVAASQNAPLLVFAASSLKGPLDEVARAFEAAYGTRVVLSYGASSALAKQIEAAAPADIFLSADVGWMDYLVERRAVDRASLTPLLGNHLVLIAPVKSSVALTIEPGFALAKALGADGYLAMGDPKSVPVGIYGRQSLETLGVWKSVEKRIAATESARAALALVARGEAPLGVVFATDAKAEPSVKIIGQFQDDSHQPIVYMATPVLASKHTATASFQSFLQGRQALAIFRQAGFTTPSAQ